MHTHLRIARPGSDLGRSVTMYQHGLGFITVGEFEDDERSSGVMCACPNSAYHFEFNFSHTYAIAPAPTPEELLVLYFSDLQKSQNTRDRLLEAGSSEVAPFNPYRRNN